MSERTKGIVIGIAAACFVMGIGTTALAASGAVTFNASNLQLNGQQISAKGENYTLDNGQQVPASVTYTDETGGGTTYLPVRRIAELLGVEIGWDSATGSVTVTGDVKPTATPAPDTATPSTDYSDWSAEEEAAYQEFKEMWNVETFAVGNDEDDGHPYTIYNAVYKETRTKTELIPYINANEANGFIDRFVSEHAIPSTEVILFFGCIDSNGERWRVGGRYTVYN